MKITKLHGLTAVLTPRNLLIACAVVVGGLHALLLLECRPTILQSGYLTEPFDALAKNFMTNLSVRVDPYIAFEGMGRDFAYMYFGPIPALIRMPFLLLWPETFLHLGYLSFLMADWLLLFYLTRLLVLIQKFGDERRFSMVTLLGVACLAGIGFGSPILPQLSKAIYSEVILWACAFSIGTMYYLFRIVVRNGGIGDMFLASLLASCALLSRVPFGVSALTACVVIAVQRMFCWYANKQLPGAAPSAAAVRSKSAQLSFELAALALPALLAVTVQLTYNYVRFESPWRFITPDQYAQSPDKVPTAFAEHGNFFIGRIPANVETYFSPGAVNRTERFPYISPRAPELTGDLFMVASVIPITAGHPWMVLAALLGIGSLMRMRNPVMWAIFGAFTIQAALTLAYLAVMERYAADFLPVLFFSGACWLLELSRTSDGRRGRQLVAGTSVLLAVVFSVVVTVSIYRLPGCEGVDGSWGRCLSLIGKISVPP